MSELHEALSHLQPHHGFLDDDQQFKEDLKHSLEQEIDLQHASQFEHSVLSHDSYDIGHLAGDHVVIHEVHDEPEIVAHWRDDKYHDHGGFDLRPDADLSHGSEHVASKKEIGHEESLGLNKNLSAKEDGVEHVHHEYGASKYNDKRIDELQKEYAAKGFKNFLQ